jgi:polyribonucleotide nucleotidyltransferase
MFDNVPLKKSLSFYGKEITLETGLLAKQATSSILITCGQTSILCAVTVGKKSSGDFFPLQVVYEERYYAVGKIKSSQWNKREGRPGDNAVLTGRMIDRSLRSLFEPSIRTEIQVVITVLSLDKIHPPDTLSVIGASVALSLCGFEAKPSELEKLNLETQYNPEKLFSGPVSCVRIGRQVNLENGEANLIINPTYEEMLSSDMDLVISGNGQEVVMVECGSNIIPDEVISKALLIAQKPLKELADFQNEFISLA